MPRSGERVGQHLVEHLGGDGGHCGAPARAASVTCRGLRMEAARTLVGQVVGGEDLGQLVDELHAHQG